MARAPKDTGKTPDAPGFINGEFKAYEPGEKIEWGTKIYTDDGRVLTPEEADRLLAGEDGAAAEGAKEDEQSDEE